MGKGKRSNDDDYTTVEPLNYLLRSRSIRTLVFWSIMTAASFAAVIGTCTALVMKYQRKDTIVLTSLTDGRFSSFPAVTLCNLNPYKRSVLSTIPPAAHLMKMYEINLNSIKSASNESSRDEAGKNVATKSIDNDENKESNGVKRVKRSDREVDPCRCNNASVTQDNGALSSAQVLYYNDKTTWACLFQCCSNSTAGTNGRPAKLENSFWKTGLTSGTGGSWVLMGCIVKCMDDEWSIPRGRNKMLDSCTPHDVEERREYSSALGISFDPAMNKLKVFTNYTDDVNKWKCLCAVDAQMMISTEGSHAANTSSAATDLMDSNAGTEMANSAPPTQFLAFTYSTENDPSSTQIGPSSTEIGPILTEIGPSTTEIAPAPTEIDPTTMEIDPSLTEIDPSLTEIDPSSTEIYPSSTDISPVSTEIDPSSTEIDPSSTEIDPSSTEIGPSSTEIGSSSTEISPSSKEIGPNSTKIGPSLTEIGPSSIEISPSSTKIGPSSMEIGPVSTEIGPSSTEIDPSSMKNGPSSTENSLSLSKSGPSSREISPLSVFAEIPVSLEPPNQSSVPLSTQQSWSPTDTAESMALVLKISTESDQKTSIATTDSISKVASFFPQAPEKTSESIINQTIENILGDPAVKWDQNALSATAVDVLGYVMGQLPEEQVVEAGYERQETIMRSFYNNGRLAAKNFTLHTDPNYGNCYTFNFFGSDIVSNQPGSEKGFSIAYLVGEEEYLPFIQSFGVRVVIHEQGDPIFPDINGYSVASRTRSSISLKKSKITTRKKCAAIPSDAHAYVFEDGRYTVEVIYVDPSDHLDSQQRNHFKACLRSCYQTGVIEKCKCGDPKIPLPTNSSVKLCDATKRSCVDAYYNNTREPECHCLHECELQFYDAALSTTVWSSGYDTSGIFASADYIKNFKKKKNMAMIDVYLESLTTVCYAEVIGYTISDLLWDMSSAIGFFTGMSVISMFESINCVQFLWEKYRRQ